jgi:hypothetical protein
MDIRFIDAILDASFELMGEKDTEFTKEYRVLSDFEEDAVGQWLKLAKARGEARDSDEVLMRLLVELHAKIDTLTALVKNETKELLDLKQKSKLNGIGFEYIRIEDEILEKDKEYYCRIEMPVFPKRSMPIFIKALDKNSAKISLMHERDEKDWNSYVTARERVEIRQKKELN